MVISSQKFLRVPCVETAVVSSLERSAFFSHTVHAASPTISHSNTFLPTGDVFTWQNRWEPHTVSFTRFDNLSHLASGQQEKSQVTSAASRYLPVQCSACVGQVCLRSGETSPFVHSTLKLEPRLLAGCASSAVDARKLPKTCRLCLHVAMHVDRRLVSRRVDRRCRRVDRSRIDRKRSQKAIDWWRHTGRSGSARKCWRLFWPFKKSGTPQQKFLVATCKIDRVGERLIVFSSEEVKAWKLSTNIVFVWSTRIITFVHGLPGVVATGCNRFSLAAFTRHWAFLVVFCGKKTSSE